MKKITKFLYSTLSIIISSVCNINARDNTPYQNTLYNNICNVECKITNKKYNTDENVYYEMTWNDFEKTLLSFYKREKLDDYQVQFILNMVKVALGTFDHMYSCFYDMNYYDPSHYDSLVTLRKDIYTLRKDIYHNRIQTIKDNYYNNFILQVFPKDSKQNNGIDEMWYIKALKYIYPEQCITRRGDNNYELFAEYIPIYSYMGILQDIMHTNTSIIFNTSIVNTYRTLLERIKECYKKEIISEDTQYISLLNYLLYCNTGQIIYELNNFIKNKVYTEENIMNNNYLHNSVHTNCFITKLLNDFLCNDKQKDQSITEFVTNCIYNGTKKAYNSDILNKSKEIMKKQNPSLYTKANNYESIFNSYKIVMKDIINDLIPLLFFVNGYSDKTFTISERLGIPIEQIMNSNEIIKDNKLFKEMKENMKPSILLEQIIEPIKLGIYANLWFAYENSIRRNTIFTLKDDFAKEYYKEILCSPMVVKKIDDEFEITKQILLSESLREYKDMIIYNKLVFDKEHDLKENKSFNLFESFAKKVAWIEELDNKSGLNTEISQKPQQINIDLIGIIMQFLPNAKMPEKVRENINETIK